MSDTKTFTRRQISSAALKIIFAALASAVALSESTVKSIVNEWMNECKLIIEIADTEPADDYISELYEHFPKDREIHLVNSQLFSIGEKQTPTKLYIESELADIHYIEFSRNSEEHNLSLHPYAGLFCGDTEGSHSSFCTISKEDNRATLTLSELSDNYSYIFNIYVSMSTPDLEQDHLIDIYSQHSVEDTDNIRCRVEQAYWLNYFSRQSSSIKLLVLAVVILVITITISSLKNDKS